MNFNNVIKDAKLTHLVVKYFCENSSIKIRNPIVETTGCKPKPTAYEKIFKSVRAYSMFISFTAGLTSSFFGRFNVKTPLTYFASILVPSVFSSSVKDLLNER